MKKFLITLMVLCAALSLLCLSAAAEELNAVPLNEQRLVVNYLTRRNSGRDLPYLFHNSMIYMPLDYYHQALLGISVSDEADQITVRTLPDEGYVNIEDNEQGRVPSVRPLVVAEKTVSLDGRVYDNASQPYPFAYLEGNLYMPLAYSYVKDMGWSIHTNLVDGVTTTFLYSDSAFTVNESDGMWNRNTAYYNISGTNCVRLINDYSRFFSNQTLSFAASAYDGFADYKNDRYDKAYLPEMELKGTTLKIGAGYYEEWVSGHILAGNKNYAHEDYVLTIDISNGTILDETLIDKSVRNMYGLLEDMDGKLLGILDLPPGHDNYAYFDGGHIILNGTMMRSYTVFMYVGSPELVEGTNMPVVIEGSQYKYWLRVEDLENYGYDMVTDFENRATYFTRNPEKEITPMDLSGTNENLPIYKSDWKIYIDGKEPKLYHNIGGYTLIYCGELGETTEDELDDGYEVMRVNTI